MTDCKDFLHPFWYWIFGIDLTFGFWHLTFDADQNQFLLLRDNFSEVEHDFGMHQMSNVKIQISNQCQISNAKRDDKIFLWPLTFGFHLALGLCHWAFRVEFSGKTALPHYERTLKFQISSARLSRATAKGRVNNDDAWYAETLRCSFGRDSIDARPRTDPGAVLRGIPEGLGEQTIVLKGRTDDDRP